MIKNIGLYHLFPFSIALCIVLILYISIPSTTPTQKTIKLTHSSNVRNGLYSDFTGGTETELAFVSSLNNKNQVTLFGSSEFSGNSNYFPYKFLTDSLNINCLAFGKGYHQHLSILCELMAAREFIKNAKITIIISPGWFESDGTNSESFIDFVRPNFLRKIIHDTLIGSEYKNHVGKFIYENSSLFNGMTKELHNLKDYYLMHQGSYFSSMLANSRIYIQQKHSNRYYIPNVKYTASKPENLPLKKWRFNTDSLLQIEQSKFIASIKNDLYVGQEYYETYLIDENGNQRTGKVSEKDYLQSNEVKDFALLIKFLKEQNVDASFVLLPLNPHFYENLSVQEPLVNYIVKELSKAEYPLLNLYCYDKNSYPKGMLRDVMHVGEYGWIMINKFIYDTYFDNHGI